MSLLLMPEVQHATGVVGVATGMQCREEGLLEGGIVVHDCLLLLLNLLRGSPANQLMFRCAGGMPH